MPQKNLSLALVSLLALSPALLACTPLAVGAGAEAGIAAAQEGGITGALKDTRIRALINDLWFKYDLETFAKLRLTVTQGRVLVTGVVQKPEARVEAIRLVWQVSGVKEVINEIRVADSSGITGFARDTWITTRLRAEITFDSDIQAINYSIDTVQGTIYLMGVARNQAELNKVMEIARTISDVKQVVSYVKMSGDIVPPAEAPPTRLAPSDSSNGGAMNNGAIPQPVPSSNDPNAGGPSAPLGDMSSPNAPLTPQPVEKQPINSGY